MLFLLFFHGEAFSVPIMKTFKAKYGVFESRRRTSILHRECNCKIGLEIIGWCKFFVVVVAFRYFSAFDDSWVMFVLKRREVKDDEKSEWAREKSSSPAIFKSFSSQKLFLKSFSSEKKICHSIYYSTPESNPFHFQASVVERMIFKDYVNAILCWWLKITQLKAVTFGAAL